MDPAFEGVPLYQVDAFAEDAFGGNPAGVCLLERPAAARWMQAVAREMNLSETAFLVGPGESCELFWFTPTTEVELCGHATLASAHILWQTGIVGAAAPIRFHTASGVLTATRERDRIDLDFPATPPEPCEPPSGLAEALGIVPAYVGRTPAGDLLVEVGSADTVRTLEPDLARLKTIPARGVIVTSGIEGSRFDFVSRFFAPRVGIDEDPVTGSAHCALGPFWADRLGRSELLGCQASEREGIVRVRLAGDRVRLGGRAVTIFVGALVVAPEPAREAAGVTA